MKLNFLNLAMGTAITLAMTNAAMAMETAGDDLEDRRATKKMRLAADQRNYPKPERAYRALGGYLTLKDLSPLEQTSKTLHTALQNASKYKALIKGWEEKIPDSNKQSEKEKFLYLQSKVPEYKVHVANLWFNFFPLKGEALKLSHYWGMRDFSSIPKLLSHLHEIHDNYLQTQQPVYRSSAFLGWAITLPKVDKADERQTNANRLEALHTIYRDTVNFSAEQRNTARYNWIEHSVKHGLVAPTTPPLSYTAAQARQDYKELLDDENTSPQTRLSVIYHMAELDFLGFGKRDLNAAESGFLTVSNHPEAHIFTKTLSKPYLAKIDAAKKETGL